MTFFSWIQETDVSLVTFKKIFQSHVQNQSNNFYGGRLFVKLDKR